MLSIFLRLVKLKLKCHIDIVIINQIASQHVKNVPLERLIILRLDLRLVDWLPVLLACLFKYEEKVHSIY